MELFFSGVEYGAVQGFDADSNRGIRSTLVGSYILRQCV